MKNKDIDKAAREYAEELSKLDDKRMYDRIDASALREVAFRTGARSRQSEIDELIEALEGIKKEWDECSSGNTKMKKTIRVEKRKGFWWTALFWAVFFTVAPIQVVCFWIGRGFSILSDLLRELCYQAWFRSLDELE